MREDCGYRDLVIETLADENAALRHDLVSYRELAQRAIHRVHDLQQQLDREAEYRRRLVDELRHLRGQIMQADVRGAA